MALTQPQQILETIKRSSTPLVVIPRGAGADGYATALGFARVMEKLGKRPEIVAADGSTPTSLHFLKDHGRIRADLPHLRKLVIDIDTARTKPVDIAREESEGRIRLSLTPDQGSWGSDDVKIYTTEYRFDLLVCVGAPDLESCGHFYEKHPDFFFRTPIINLDHSPTNEHFGALNAVDLTAASCGEVCHDLFHAIDPELIDEETATAFLTGMISKTKSFKTANVTPKTLQTASSLVARGARREEIVRHLYRTRSVPTLRLWGRALARLKQDTQAKLVWTLLSQQDFLHAGAAEEDLPDVVDELITTSPHAEVVLILYENRDRNICGLLRSERPHDAARLSEPFHGTGNREESRMCFVGQSLVEVEQTLVPHLTKSLQK